MAKDMELEFSKALGDFILAMEKLPPVFDAPEINGLTNEPCRILRIARLEVMASVPPQTHAAGKYEMQSGLFFFDGKHDSKRAYVLDKNVGEGSRVSLKASPYAEADDWTEEELHNIEVFVKTLYIFTSRMRYINLAEIAAYKDENLGIHNMNYFNRQCAELLKKELISDCICCRFNLKGFSFVNRRFGREGGTEIMRKYIGALTEIVGDRGMVCRVGGDHFIALFPNEKADEVKNYLIEATVETGINGSEKITLHARAGYCPVTEDCRKVTNLMDRASAAESIANTNQGLQYVYYDEETRRRTETAKWIEGLFSDAVRDEEFMVYYQPKVELEGLTVYGAEALCRWKHKGEIIQPVKFIPIFEQSGNICVLDFYMLEHVCRDIRRWLDGGMPVVKASVHMSRVNLGSKDLAERIIKTADKYGIPKEYIEIELKETITDLDFSELKKVVTALNDAGISTSVDSFGVRYSSLTLLREISWSVLKIDRSLLPKDGEPHDAQKENMLKYVISLSQALGLDCVAEGVETAKQVETLKEMGCRRGQGFYFDKPLPVKKFEERLKSGGYGVVPDSSKERGEVRYFDELLDELQ